MATTTFPFFATAVSNCLVVGDTVHGRLREEHVKHEGFGPAPCTEVSNRRVYLARPRPGKGVLFPAPLKALLVQQDRGNLAGCLSRPGQEAGPQVPRAGLETVQRAGEQDTEDQRGPGRTDQRALDQLTQAYEARPQGAIDARTRLSVACHCTRAPDGPQRCLVPGLAHAFCRRGPDSGLPRERLVHRGHPDLRSRMRLDKIHAAGFQPALHSSEHLIESMWIVSCPAHDDERHLVRLQLLRARVTCVHQGVDDVIDGVLERAGKLLQPGGAGYLYEGVPPGLPEGCPSRSADCAERVLLHDMTDLVGKNCCNGFFAVRAAKESNIAGPPDK